jgi:tripartite-type tricarboxylate transporter receptor subunit TctC
MCRFLSVLVAILFALPAAAQDAQSFPSRPIRIIVPFPAGATTDMLARLFAQRLSDGLNQAVVVENVGGAGGSLGADQVAKAAPDGYTLLFHNITFTTTTSSLQFVGRSRHDIEQDFVPIAVGAYVPLLLLAHPSVPARDLKEFVEYAKQTKEPLFYGSTGPGSIMNLMGEVLKRDTGIKIDHVPFRGAAAKHPEVQKRMLDVGAEPSGSSQAEMRDMLREQIAKVRPMVEELKLVVQ